MTSGGLLPNLGSAVFTKLQLGRHYLMRDPVPIWLLGTMMAISQEEVKDNTLTTPLAYSQYRWRLPEPLFVDAGQVLSSQFFRYGDALSGDITIQVTYAGRTVSPDQQTPRLIPIPYAAPFVTTVGNVYQQSNENHLFNPFDHPIRIQRLTGRVHIAQSMVLSPTPVTAGSNTTLLINDSWGGKMVNNNTGPTDVFDSLRAAWTVDTIMPAKGMYEIRAWNIRSSTALHVAMIGTREERAP